MTDPDMGAWQYEYDAVGNLSRQTDARGEVLCFYYDKLNRLAGKKYNIGVAEACPEQEPPEDNDPYDPFWTNVDVWYKYDQEGTFGLEYGPTEGVGRRTGMKNEHNKTRWVYDLRGRVVAEISEFDPVGDGTWGTMYATQYTYDPADRVQTMTYPGDDQGGADEVITTTYSAQGLPQTLSGAYETYVSDAQYDEAGRLRLLSLQNGALQTQYDYYPWNDANNGRLQNILSGSPSDPTFLQDLHYAYDPAGNVASITDDGVQTTYAYDDLDRLTTQNDEVLYGYDHAGNLTGKAELFALTLSYTDTAHIHAPSMVADPALAYTDTLTYDANGNLTQTIHEHSSSETCTMGDALHWDVENHLAEREVTQLEWEKWSCIPEDPGCVPGWRLVCRTTVVETYAYDGDGTLVQRTDGEGDHVYVGPLYEIHPDHSTSYYHFGGRRIAMRDGSLAPVSYLFADHLGSTRAVHNDSETSTQTYTPWGEIPDTWDNALPTDYTYTGQREANPSPGIRLLDYNARHYYPFTGRFISPDTIVPEPGNPQSLNRYSYANNNALRYTDPSGYAAIGGDDYDDADYYESFVYFAEVLPAYESLERKLQGEEPWGFEIGDYENAIYVGIFVPDEGTSSLGISFTGGAVVYGQFSPAVTIDSQGDFYLNYSIEGGSITLGTASITGFFATTNASDGEDILGEYMDVGGSGGIGAILGYDRFTMDINGARIPGGRIDGNKWNFGGGFDFGAGPVEGHFGGGTTQKITGTYNIYDLLHIKPLPSSYRQ